MKAMRNAVVGIVAVAAVGAGFAVTAANGAPSRTGLPSSTPTAAVRSGLQFSREEERMARDLYRQFADEYGVRPFAEISRSEQRHFDAIGRLLATYGVADPSSGAKPGVYADATVQKLYDGWRTKGLTSVRAAFQVGVALEKRDIADLQGLARLSGAADLDRVYGQLQNASQHHLAAFNAAASGTTLPRAGAPVGRPGGAGTPGPGRGPRGRAGGNGPAGGRMGAGHGPGSGMGDCPLA